MVAEMVGIVHRDIKPENILLDAQGRSYITDFGISRDLLAAPGGTLSTAGVPIGTPALMSPEQSRGDLSAIDGRTDIYGLGATLYLQLTGRYPFAADKTPRNLELDFFRLPHRSTLPR